MICPVCGADHDRLNCPKLTWTEVRWTPTGKVKGIEHRSGKTETMMNEAFRALEQGKTVWLTLPSDQ